MQLVEINTNTNTRDSTEFCLLIMARPVGLAVAWGERLLRPHFDDAAGLSRAGVSCFEAARVIAASHVILTPVNDDGPACYVGLGGVAKADLAIGQHDLGGAVVGKGQDVAQVTHVASFAIISWGAVIFLQNRKAESTRYYFY